MNICSTYALLTFDVIFGVMLGMTFGGWAIGDTCVTSIFPLPVTNTFFFSLVVITFDCILGEAGAWQTEFTADSQEEKGNWNFSTGFDFMKLRIVYCLHTSHLWYKLWLWAWADRSVRDNRIGCIALLIRLNHISTGWIWKKTKVKFFINSCHFCGYWKLEYKPFPECWFIMTWCWRGTCVTIICCPCWEVIIIFCGVFAVFFSFVSEEIAKVYLFVCKLIEFDTIF